MLRYPGFPLSIYVSAIFLGFLSSSFTASSFLSDSPYVSFLLRLSCSVMRFLFYHLFFLWFFPPEFSAPAFTRYCLLSSHALLFLSLGVWNWSASLAFPRFSYTVHGFPSSFFPSCSSLPFHYLGALLTRFASLFPSTTGSSLWAESVPVWLLCTPRSLVFRTPVNLSLCLHPPAFIPLLLQSAVPYGYLSSSRGFSFHPPSCCQSPSWVRCPYRFNICYVPRRVSLRSLLLSFLLQLLPAVPRGSSFLLVDLFLLPPRSWHWLSWGISLPIGFLHFRFGSSLFVFSACWDSLPCVLRMLLFLASLG